MDFEVIRTFLMVSRVVEPNRLSRRGEISRTHWTTTWSSACRYVTRAQLQRADAKWAQRFPGSASNNIHRVHYVRIQLDLSLSVRLRDCSNQLLFLRPKKKNIYVVLVTLVKKKMGTVGRHEVFTFLFLFWLRSFYH